MAYQIQDFEREYAGKSDDDLLRLAFSPQDLVDDAKIALQAEMNRRGLRAADIDTARFEQERDEEREERETANRMLQAQWRGLGFQTFCKWDRTFDPESKTEEFTTTRFFILFQIPLIPVATYRVRRRKGVFQKAQILERLPLNWSQVLWVWLLGAIGILALILFGRYGLPLLHRL